MAFFGRRKPGFSKESSITASDLTQVINDSNNGTFREDDSPKTEKRDWKALANEVLDLNDAPEAIADTAAEAESPAEPEQPLTAEQLQEIAKAEGTRMDLFDYLDTLPDVDDPFPPMPEEPVEEEPAEAPPIQLLLADFIRERSAGALLSSLKYLQSEVEGLDDILKLMAEDPECASIHSIKGTADTYYFDSDVMTDNYARIASLIEDKDALRTIAEMVRWNGKTYPSPTPLAYFMRHPYKMTEAELDQALDRLFADPAYQDIKPFVSAKGSAFLYSEQNLTERYAKSLADRAEDDEG